VHVCKIFHFAGHGLSDSKDPSHSSLLLEDWKDEPLTVETLRGQKLQETSPFLAACSTGANEHDQLLDEGVHLVSACQLAGFRHVVGTLWEVSDKHCVDVANILYKTLQEEGMTDIAVARGLHHAIRTLRDGDDIFKKAVDESRIPSKTDVHLDHGIRNTSNKNWLQGTTVQSNTQKVILETGDDDDDDGDETTHDERDAILLHGECFNKESKGGFYWVPYIHFGG
jgi:CHAT domain-containing protein